MLWPKLATEPTEVYRGNCHCGAFVMDVPLTTIKEGFSCNCSFCSKKSIRWAMDVVPLDKIQIVKGSLDDLTAYTFGEKYRHLFCPNCGIYLLGVAGKAAGVNLRCLQDVDTWNLKVHQLDGGSIKSDYQPPANTVADPPELIPNGEMYRGSCHCGAVRYAFSSKPLDQTEAGLVCECNCSFCDRAGSLWAHVERVNTQLEGRENMSDYTFGYRWAARHFCKTCGDAIDEPNMSEQESKLALLPETKALQQQLPAGLREFYEGKRSTRRPLNLNLVLPDHADLVNKKMKRHRFDGKSELGPAYKNP